MPVIFKSDGSNGLELLPLVKASPDFDERGELLVVVYPPNLPDTDGHFADADGIKSMVHSFAKSGRGIDIEHDGKVLPKSDAFVAESFIIQKGDPRYAGWKDVDGKDVDVAGGWGAVFKIDNPGLRKLYREGVWNGVSMFGQGEMLTIEKSDDRMDKFITLMLEKMGVVQPKNGDLEMDAKELAALLAENNKALIDGIAKAIKPEPPKAETPPAKPDAEALKKAEAEIIAGVEFAGSFDSPTDVEAHAKKVQLALAKSRVNWTDPKSVKAYTDLLAKSDSKDTKPGESPEIQALERKLAELRKASNQPTGSGKDNTTKPTHAEIAKAIINADRAEHGLKALD